MGNFKVSRLLSASFFHKENSRVDGRVQDRVIVQVCPHRECVGHGAKPSSGVPYEENTLRSATDTALFALEGGYQMKNWLRII